MKRLRKGNVLLKLKDTELLQVLHSYFLRKYYNVFCPLNKTEFSRTVKQNALTFAIFDEEGINLSNIEAADYLFEFDNRVVIYFICPSEEVKQEVEKANPHFKTIGKPFAMRNLLNRMTNDVNKQRENEDNLTTFKIGNYKLNLTNNSLIFKDPYFQTEQHLTKKEAAILKILCLNEGKIVSRHRLLMDIWQKDNYQVSRSMDVYMTRLRHYLSSDSNISIDNKHSLGYCLKIKEQ